MSRYRITTTYPVYFNGECLPSTGYVIQVLYEGFFFDRWIDVATYQTRKRAEEIMKTMN